MFSTIFFLALCFAVVVTGDNDKCSECRKEVKTTCGTNIKACMQQTMHNVEMQQKQCHSDQRCIDLYSDLLGPKTKDEPPCSLVQCCLSTTSLIVCECSGDCALLNLRHLLNPGSPNTDITFPCMNQRKPTIFNPTDCDTCKQSVTELKKKYEQDMKDLPKREAEELKTCGSCKSQSDKCKGTVKKVLGSLKGLLKVALDILHEQSIEKICMSLKYCPSIEYVAPF